MRLIESKSLLVGVLALLLAPRPCNAAEPRGPVLHTGVPSPTKDKPQSKLWYDHGSWWTWLPVRGGSAIWKRTPVGWIRQSALDESLRGWPGQADVWSARGRVCAALTDGARLAAACLRWDARKLSYVLDGEPALLESIEQPGNEQVIETATIAADADNRFWVAYALGGRVLVRDYRPGTATKWSPAVQINEHPLSPDDICAITSLPSGVGVMWSDQQHDAVFFRSHVVGEPDGAWRPIETVEAGNKTADDHIHLAVAPNGTVFAATKNSADAVGQPQLVLRVRGRSGQWTSIPYALRTAKAEPSRPIVLLDAAGQRLHLLHTLYSRGPGRDQSSTIAWQSSPAASPDLKRKARILLDMGRRLNDVTASKTAPPPGTDWIVLASDPEGNVYEASIGSGRL